MSTKNDGLPAFPVESQKHDINGNWEEPAHPGMSLLDYFAAAALPGVQAMALELAKAGIVKPALDIAKASYEIADAMLYERSKQ